MKSFYKSAIVLILLYSLFSMPALADEKGSEFYNFIQSQLKNLPGSSLGSNASTSDSNFVIKIGTVHDVDPGSMVDVPVTLSNAPWKLYGFDLLFRFNSSALSLSDVIPGDDLFDAGSGCGWEYFAWRQGSSANCGSSPCPAGIIRVAGIADLGAPPTHPSCLSPETPANMFSLRFLSISDTIFKCLLVPIDFIWYDCFDNALSYDSGIDSLSNRPFLGLSDHVFSGPILQTPSEYFPALGGVPDSCLTNFEPEEARRVIDFHNGYIVTECEDTALLIGDINANKIPYEIADYVLFLNYFRYGESMLFKTPERQIAATDINRDGQTLKLEDFIQLFRIVTGYQDPNSTTDIEIDDGLFILNDRDETTILAYSQFVSHLIWFLFEGEIAPQSLDESIVVTYHFDGQFTRILVGGFGPSEFTYEPIFDYSGSGNLIELQASNFIGHELKSNYLNCGLGVPCFSESAIGDLNLNGIDCEIIDAFLFVDYFLYGTSVFTLDVDQQSENSDINLDGIVLGIADLVMAIRGLAGEIASCPFDFDSTSPNTAIFRQDNQTRTIEMISPDTMGAALLVFDGEVTPALLQQNVTISSVFDSGQTRILIWGFASIFNTVYFAQGPLISYTGIGQLVEVKTATRRGDKVNTIIDISTDIVDNPDNLPEVFTLHQNYPNPFNIETAIKFDLPRASKVEFEIINILGQVVYNVTNRYSAGSHTIYWDGSSNSGQTVGSGVYYYRITAGDFVSSKKMILLK